MLGWINGHLDENFFNTTYKILSHRLCDLLTNIEKSKFLCHYDVSP